MYITDATQSMNLQQLSTLLDSHLTISSRPCNSNYYFTWKKYKGSLTLDKLCESIDNAYKRTVPDFENIKHIRITTAKKNDYLKQIALCDNLISKIRELKSQAEKKNRW